MCFSWWLQLKLLSTGCDDDHKQQHQEDHHHTLIDGTITCDVMTRTIRFIPFKPLDPGSLYHVQVMDIPGLKVMEDKQKYLKRRLALGFWLMAEQRGRGEE